jgi:hypothetical protein
VIGGNAREKSKMKTQKSLTRRWRKIFQRRRPRHDPMLVLNMSIFNFADGWNRTFNPLETRERGI